MSLAKLFEPLPVPTSGAKLPAFTTVPILDGAHKLGKDAQGAPVLLIKAARPSGMPPVQVELEHVAVQHDVTCLVSQSGGHPEQATFTLVRCRQSDRVLREYFLGVIEGVLPLLGPSPSEGQVREVVDALAELFRALEKPARKAVQGLWTELLIIAEAADAVLLARSWHAVPGEPYDFSLGPQRLEVKSAVADERRHHFRLDQLRPPGSIKVLVASALVDRSGGGCSVAELLGGARSRVAGDPDLLLRVDQIVAASLGQNWRNGLEDRFDLQRARESLSFYWAEAIPSIDPSLPVGVSDVKFRSDLTHVTAVEPRTLEDARGLFNAALPARSVRRG
jgi:hypothetical protein